MTESRETLEQRLLRDPFAIDARAAYARVLFDAEEYAPSLEQWRIVLKQEAKATHQLAAALCCLRLSDREGAARHVHDARSLPDFDPQDPRLAEVAPKTPAKLSLVAGGRRDLHGADVISIGRHDAVRFSDVIGMRELKKLVRLRIVEPFLRPGLFERFKKSSGGGVLLYGPPGCGKTLIARAIASECEASFTAVGISDILNLWVGQSEKNLAEVFDKARREERSVLFFDELDALAFSRSKAHSDHTRTLVNEFLSQLDGVAQRNNHVLILAATNMPWDVDEAMKRPGRFDRQIFVAPPDAEARAEMLRNKLRDVPHEAVDFESLAARCEHYSGADMDGVLDHAKDSVLADILETHEERPIRLTDLLAGIDATTPTTLDWLKTARNLVKYGGAGHAYKDVEKYLRAARMY